MQLRFIIVTGTLLFLVASITSESHAQGWTWADRPLVDSANVARSTYAWQNTIEVRWQHRIDGLSRSDRHPARADLRSADAYFNLAYWNIQGAWASNNRRMYGDAEWYLLLSIIEMNDAVSRITHEIQVIQVESATHVDFSRVLALAAVRDALIAMRSEVQSNRERCIYLYHLAHISAGG